MWGPGKVWSKPTKRSTWCRSSVLHHSCFPSSYILHFSPYKKTISTGGWRTIGTRPRPRGPWRWPGASSRCGWSVGDICWYTCPALSPPIHRLRHTWPQFENISLFYKENYFPQNYVWYPIPAEGVCWRMQQKGQLCRDEQWTIAFDSVVLISNGTQQERPHFQKWPGRVWRPALWFRFLPVPRSILNDMFHYWHS